MFSAKPQQRKMSKDALWHVTKKKESFSDPEKGGRRNKLAYTPLEKEKEEKKKGREVDLLDRYVQRRAEKGKKEPIFSP